jgi:molybdopterin/thiamine biosynthesis adenylyltransferase
MYTTRDSRVSVNDAMSRIDRQMLIHEWNQSRLSETCIEIVTTLKSPPLPVLAIAQACIMAGFGEVRLTGRHWDLSVNAIEQFKNSIGSGSRFSCGENLCQDADQRIFLPGCDDENDQLQSMSIYGRFTEEKLAWNVSALPDLTEAPRTRGNIPFQLVLSGLMLAEALRLCMPLQRWQDSHMAGSVVFPKQASLCSGRCGDMPASGRDLTLALVGGGALGNWFFFGMQFARIRRSIARLVIIDPDTVSLSNLNRQVWFTLEDCGRNKAEVLAERLQDRLPDTEISWLDSAITDERFFEERGIAPDIIVSGVDNWQARALLNRYAVAHRCVLVNGGSDPYSANIYAYQPSETPCLDCMMDIENKAATEQNSRSCADAEPSVVTTNMIAAGFMLWWLETGGLDRVLTYSINEPYRLGLSKTKRIRPGCGCGE